MPLKLIDTDVYAAGQPTPADIQQWKQEGIATVICHRHDHEDGAIPHEEIAAAAAAAGIRFVHLPVTSGAVTDEDVAAMAELVEEVAHPLVCYCRSGGRATRLYHQAVEHAAASAPARKGSHWRWLYNPGDPICDYFGLKGEHRFIARSFINMHWYGHFLVWFALIYARAFPY